MSKIFEILLILARPAAGKSEIIKYLTMQDPKIRQKKYHIGNLKVIDDFPMLWSWFEEDTILSDLGHPRLHTTKDGYFIKNYFWDLLIRRINLEYKKLQRDIKSNNEVTTIIEFSRGEEHGGYKRAFEYLSDEILRKAAVLHINISWEESLRKNRKRFNPKRPDSILEHGLSENKLKKLYYKYDWQKLSKLSPNFLNIRGFKVPFVIFENNDDVTTEMGPKLGDRLEKELNKLWKFYKKNQ